jgi:ADP-ribosyl-[dinitrogen reductase] hydrolase
LKKRLKQPKKFTNFSNCYFNAKIMANKFIIGGIAGDIIGSVYEFHNVKTQDFKMFGYGSDFTDDSVLTVATMHSINDGKFDYGNSYREFGTAYPGRGYGSGFMSWLYSKDGKGLSYGNGSGMRVSPVGWAFDTIEEVLEQAKRSAETSHGHEEGIKGAQAVAAAVFMARTGSTKNDIKDFTAETFGYDMSKSCDEIRPTYGFEENCQNSVPQAITAFLESSDYENAVRLAISLGGDSDTIADMTGAIAEAFYKEVPEAIMKKTMKILDGRLANEVMEFSDKYGY